MFEVFDSDGELVSGFETFGNIDWEIDEVVENDGFFNFVFFLVLTASGSDFFSRLKELLDVFNDSGDVLVIDIVLDLDDGLIEIEDSEGAVFNSEGVVQPGRGGDAAIVENAWEFVDDVEDVDDGCVDGERMVSKFVGKVTDRSGESRSVFETFDGFESFDLDFGSL